MTRAVPVWPGRRRRRQTPLVSSDQPATADQPTTGTGERDVDAVIFDLGGVLMRNGRPKDLAERFPDHDLDVLVQAMMGPYHEDTDHPWHRLERGEITLAEVRAHNKEALARLGIEPPPAGSSAATLAFRPNEEMLALLVDLRTAGLRTGMLTNNVREFRDLWWPLMPWTDLFDDIVDSHEVGMRKPNPAIYSLALERLGTTAERTAFLDDVESNLAGARNVGIVGVLVEDDSAPAIETVRRLAGLA